MTTGDKAKRTTVAIGPLSIDGFQMPDGSYRMSITGAAVSVGLTARNAFDFLRSKAAERLLDGGYTCPIFEIEVESAEHVRSRSRINAIPLEVAMTYTQPDALREQVTRLEQQLRNAGLESWQLPQTER
jgi:hypothetical protein